MPSQERNTDHLESDLFAHPDGSTVHDEQTGTMEQKQAWRAIIYDIGQGTCNYILS